MLTQNQNECRHGNLDTTCVDIADFECWAGDWQAFRRTPFCRLMLFLASPRPNNSCMAMNADDNQSLPIRLHTSQASPTAVHCAAEAAAACCKSTHHQVLHDAKAGLDAKHDAYGV